jgi:DNA-binding response OmpR family regulator
MKEPPEIETAATTNVTVLCVSPDDADGAALECIFHESGWTVHTKSERTLNARPTLDSASSVLRKSPVPIVVCEANLLPGTWREMLGCISLLPDPPLLIVSSRLADDYLWAEALNLGAYDVLSKPFDATEVIRIVSLAWRHWQDRRRSPLRPNRTEED